MCVDKIKCSERNERWKGNLITRKNLGEETLESIRRENDLGFYRSSLDITKRNLINEQEINEVLKHGWVVDAYPDMILILGYVKDRYGYRAIHVKLKKQDHWYIRDAYFPLREDWGKNFDNKECFCYKGLESVVAM